MSKRTPTLLALAVGALACTAPAAAQAGETARITQYELTFDLRVDHHHVTDFSSAHQTSHTKLDSTSRLLGKMDVAFANGRIQPTSNGKARGFTTAEWKADATDVGGHGSESCTATPGLPVEWGAPTISEPILTPLGDPEIDLRFSESSNMAWDSCSGDLGAPAFPDLGDPSKELGAGPLDAVFTMPTTAIGNGKIIQLVSGPPAGSASFCPGNEDPTTTACSYGWAGTVTLTKTGETVIPDADGSAGTPAGGGSTQASRGKTRGATISAKAKADAKGRTVTFDADCPLGCVGIAHLDFARRSGKASAAANRRPAIRFTVKPGRRKVTLNVPASMRRTLRTKGRASLNVTLTPRGGARVTRTLRVRVAKRKA